MRMTNCVKRQSNFELLRIISMLLIILSHVVGQNDLIGNTSELNQALAILLGSASRIGVALFVMIGSWFLAGKELQSSRILKIWGEVFFYTVSITIILLVLGYPVTKIQFISAFFPFLRRPLWFAGAYIALMLLSPFLNEVFLWKEQKQRKLLVTLTIIIVLVCTTSKFMDTFLCNVMGFIYLYLLTGYYKYFLHDKLSGKYKNTLLLLLWVGYAIIACVKWYSLKMADINPLWQYINSITTQYLSDFKALPDILISGATFYYFANLNIGTNKWINFVAQSAFGVYIIHQTPAFIPVLWKDIFRVESWLDSKFCIIFCILTAVGVYCIGMIVDTFRRRYGETLWLKSKTFKKLCNISDCIFRVNEK